MTYTELLGQDVPSGVYFFVGEEDYLKLYTLGEIRRRVFPAGSPEAELTDCNRMLLREEACTPAAIEEALLRPPVFAPRRLVEIDFPDAAAFSGREREAYLRAYDAAKMAPETVCVTVFPAGAVDPGTPRRPSALWKTLSQAGTPIDFPLQQDAPLFRWMRRHLAAYHVSLDDGAAAQILSLCGRRMLTLSGELAKLGAWTAARAEREARCRKATDAASQPEAVFAAVSPADIAAVVTRTPEDDVFRLANCILAGDVPGAYLTLADRIRRRDDPIYLLSQITHVFSDAAAAALFQEEGFDASEFADATKLHAYKAALLYRAVQNTTADALSDALDACLAADQQLKSGVSGYAPIERLLGILA